MNVGLENPLFWNFWLEIINFIVFCDSKFYIQFHSKTYQSCGI